MKKWIKKWWCIFIHKKEIRQLDVNNETGMFYWGFERFEGCSKCDVWRRL
jgi:hypothetical protein